MCRLTLPCKRLTPFTAPLPRTARYARLKLSDGSFGFCRPKASNVVELDTEPLLGVTAEVLLDKGRSEAVKTVGHCRVGCEQISSSRDGQRNFEGLTGLLHETACAFKHGKCRMSLIQMADFRLDAQRI